MAGELASFRTSFVEILAQPSLANAPSGRIRVWCNSSDNNNLYAQDEVGSNTQITNGGALATGNAQYLWDWFVNSMGITIPNYSAVTLVQGGGNDGKIMLADADDITKDTFLGIVWGGSIAPGGTGKVIYAGKVPGAVTSLGYSSNTIVYMSASPGVFTNVAPSFISNTVFVIGFTKGDDLYLRPEERSDLG
jgi:hypothetical protein